MRKIILLITVLITASFLSACDPAATTNSGNKPANAVNNAAPAVNAAAIETDIKKMVSETAAALAKNDAAALDKMYADNYLLVNLDGSIQNKADRLASLKSGDTKFDSFAYDEVNVRSNPEGTGAIVIARATATGMNKGKKIEGTVRVTQVWRKTADGWRQVTGQATQITGGPAPSSAANSAATGPPAATGNTNQGK